MEVRTYPVQRPSFLCNVIANEWSIHVTEQELREPKPETVQNIYAAILADLLSLDIRSFDREGQVAIGELESPVCLKQHSDIKTGRLNCFCVCRNTTTTPCDYRCFYTTCEHI